MTEDLLLHRAKGDRYAPRTATVIYRSLGNRRGFSRVWAFLHSVLGYYSALIKRRIENISIPRIRKWSIFSWKHTYIYTYGIPRCLKEQTWIRAVLLGRWHVGFTLLFGIQANTYIIHQSVMRHKLRRVYFITMMNIIWCTQYTSNTCLRHCNTLQSSYIEDFKAWLCLCN